MPDKGVRHRSDHVHTEVITLSDAGREPLADEYTSDNDKALADVTQAVFVYVSVARSYPIDIPGYKNWEHRKAVERPFCLVLLASRSQSCVQTRHTTEDTCPTRGCGGLEAGIWSATAPSLAARGERLRNVRGRLASHASRPSS